jgi:hypothetical protein
MFSSSTYLNTSSSARSRLIWADKGNDKHVIINKNAMIKNDESIHDILFF